MCAHFVLVIYYSAVTFFLKADEKKAVLRLLGGTLAPESYCVVVHSEFR